jgi:cysteinyl-tRNA synthetase
MAVRIYNTLSGTVDELIPGGIKKDNIKDYPPVTLYACGPTVYSYAHIGNFRTFIFNDFLRRYLKFRGFTVNQAMNITDVDDKTITAANEEAVSLKNYTDRYSEIFFEDCRKLNIEPVEHVPRATESIDAMVDIIKHLDKKGLLYERDGSLYFSISKFVGYGKLSRLDRREIKSGLRYDTDEYTKDDVRDFALWKAPKEGEISWDTPYGAGRPGWHIECSAMIRKIFKGTIDIHTGGVDLIFPHHENEIAQSEAAYDEPFVRHWIHVEHLLVDNSKMSKSKGNFYTLRDLLDRGYSPRPIRYLLLSGHYRKQLNFTLEGITHADQALARIDNFLVRLNDIKGKSGDSKDVPVMIDAFLTDFTDAVDDDLNISRGLGILFDFVHGMNTLISEEKISIRDREKIIKALKKIDTVLGLIFMTDYSGKVDTDEIDALILERAEAKKEKNYQQADEIRDRLTSMGVILEDTKDGTRWKIKK